MPRNSPSDTDLMPNFSGFLLDNRFKLLDPLGSGAYGRVYKAADLNPTSKSPRFFAVKCLLRPPAGSRRDQFQLREFALHLLVSKHPNIVTFHKVFQDSSFIYVVLDLCIGGDLFSAINPKNIFFRNDALVKTTFLQILDAIEYCHQHDVYHRDLKPENILCSKDHTRVFLADFGLSTQARVSKEFRCGSAFYVRTVPPFDFIIDSNFLVTDESRLVTSNLFNNLNDLDNHRVPQQGLVVLFHEEQ
jgi:serine/threonine protein kinase